MDAQDVERPGFDGGSVSRIIASWRKESGPCADPPKYQPEFRERCVRIARESERPIAAVARDLGIHPETLRVWVRLDEADDGTRAAPSSG